VVAHADDGASTGGGFLGPNMPDGFHLNNANMSTPPNGQSPTMQMYLFTWRSTGDPTADANGGDDASVVYHEYTHGLSNRLVTYSNGVGALDAHQSGSMGEAWSDWYAMDYLVDEGFETDDPSAGDVILGAYLGNGNSTLRSKALDCPALPDPCDGYTYGDLGTIGAGPEVHDDGEIWAQTLWDIREAVGVTDARFLVTEAMRNSPPNPSFLDMRNEILLANEVNVTQNGAVDHAGTLWTVFANRGMGYFASTDHASDVSPTEDFNLPPDPASGFGTVAGDVTDTNTGAPVSGARVEIVGSPDNLFAFTNSLGRYSIGNVPVGTYPVVRATRSAYEHSEASNVAVQNGITTEQDLQVKRNWAAYGGGARVVKYTGPNYSSDGCGPNGAIDQSQVTGWGSVEATQRLTVRLPSFVDVTGFAIDPGATCGDAESASLAGYRIETSRNGTTFTHVASGTFGAGDNHRLNTVSAGGTRIGVRYVRLTMLNNQEPVPDFEVFMDMSELSVYGKFRPACLGLAATRIGTEGRNTIRGTGGADVIVANGGNDRILGRGGKDVVCGGAGNDTIVGGSGVDRIDAGSGNDKVNSRDGVRERTIRGGSGRDRLRKDRRDRATGFERRY
jgi:extracellular elastinolytic metalloproteinase